ncbi:hypothetical protein [Thermodesulfobacterium hydrogeniphilum]|uniref:hypothetical protein n=1 Tax=Thermodesulfobacterium hydrogeniphilum TaxID=161156 RepID=UPI000570A925|nr:hypothetical protein [Thermodesulfobacterium hydrogeniphilum]
MKKVVSFMLSLALAGLIGLTAGCKKKEKAPAPETPKKEVTAPEKEAPAKATPEKKAEEQKAAPEKTEHK